MLKWRLKTSRKTAFIDTFQDAEQQNFKYILSGFGRTEEEIKDFLKNPTEKKSKNFLTDVYRLPSFSLCAGGNRITWKNLYIAVIDKKSIGIDLILPSTMFRGMELRWDQKDVNKPYIEIISDTDMKYVFVQKHGDSFFGTELLKYIYSQDDAEGGRNTRRI